MLQFVVLLLVPIMIQHVSIAGHTIDYKKRNINAIKIFFLLLTILVMFRHESIGNDTQYYMHIFEKISRMQWLDMGKNSIEIGFSYFNKIISLVTKDPQIFLMIAAVVTSFMVYPTYKRLCVDASLSIVIFCILSTFVMLFSGMRQMLAIGIGFIAYEFARKKRLVLFLLAVLVATTFHTSAFMLIFMYPLYHANITKKWLFAAIPVLGIIFVFNKQIFSVLTRLLEGYTKYEGTMTQTGAYTMIILFTIFAIFAFVIPDESLLDRETIGLRNFLLLSLAIQLFAPLHNLAMRMNYYYIIFIPLLLPKIIACRSKRWNQVALAGRHIMVIFFLIYFFVNAYSGGKLNVFPHHFFWENVQ